MTKLTERIIELVPEIKDLRPGCRLSLYGGEVEGVITLEIGICSRHKTYKGCQNYEGLDNDECGNIEGFSVLEVLEGSHSTYHIKKDEVKAYEIRGRDITLADVLRAIEKNYNPKFEAEIAVMADGSILEKKYERMREEFWGYYGRTWNLTTDLDGQSPETKAFLEKILLT